MGGVNLTRIAGPAVTGLLIAPIGSGWVYMMTVVLFGVAAVSMLALPALGMKAERRSEPLIANFVGGFQYVSHSPLFRVLMLTALLCRSSPSRCSRCSPCSPKRSTTSGRARSGS